jgi:type II secretory pathway pseudopilin PulG
MSRLLRRALARAGDESGLTLIEMLVAAMMSVLIVGAVGSMLLGALRAQPDISEQAQDVSSTRWVLERMTREIRNGVRVESASASSVSFVTYLRRSVCGGSAPASSATGAIKCKVTYSCTTTSCSRSEMPEGVSIGTPRTVVSGINSSQVFCYVPSTEPDPLTCGPAKFAEETTYIGVRLRLPNPDGTATALTASDGASLRNATLLK